MGGEKDYIFPTYVLTQRGTSWFSIAIIYVTYGRKSPGMGVRRLEFSSSRIVSNPKLWIYFMYNSDALVMTILIALDFIVLHDFKTLSFILSYLSLIKNV